MRGTVPYGVVLWLGDGGLDWTCSCPVGEAGDFCKHCVALACAVAEREPPDARTPRTRATEAASRRSTSGST
ncbi:MAG: SWIM zinc finger family protein [Acidimicrobiia bacterium]|nr:SWIM zinc finger family protein [Acidimicrobiia bacterium]